MEVTLKVKRFDPEGSAEPYYQQYKIDMPSNATVLDTLIEAREYQDGTLSLRCSVGSSRVDLQACKLEYSIVSPK